MLAFGELSKVFCCEARGAKPSWSGSLLSLGMRTKSSAQKTPCLARCEHDCPRIEQWGIFCGVFTTPNLRQPPPQRLHPTSALKEELSDVGDVRNNQVSLYDSHIWAHNFFIPQFGRATDNVQLHIVRRFQNRSRIRRVRHQPVRGNCRDVGRCRFS